MGVTSITRTCHHPPREIINFHRMLSRVLAFCLASSVFSQNNHIISRPHRQERLEVVEVVEPVSDQDVSLLSRIVGKENPGCVERFVCEMYKTGETMNGIPYLLMSITNAAVSYTVAEQFNQSIEMEAITRSSKIGRSDGTCHHMECPIADGRLREVTDWLAGLEEILGYIVNSVSTSL